MAEEKRDRTDESPGPCPPWCCRDHSTSNHVEDRLHQSEPRLAPVVLRRHPQFLEEQATSAVELLVLAVQADGGPAWIQVLEAEDDRNALTLSTGSARRLSRVLDEVLDSLAEASPSPE